MNQIGEPAPCPLEPLSEGEIVDAWKSEDVVVSILCPAYQHGSFIEDAIKGFLAQRTSFRYEIIIRDDCSHDNTQEVIRKYEKAYPKIVKSRIENKNTWPNIKALPVLLGMAKGRFIAICEGDDYWIDDLKLQKQVDFLRQNRNVSLLKTRALAVEDGVIISPLLSGGTRTFMYPSSIEVPEQLSSRCYFGDTVLQAILQQQGEVCTLEDITAVWRKHSGGVCGGLLESNAEFLNLQRSQTNFWIAQYFYEQGNSREARKHMVRSLSCIAQNNVNDRKRVIASFCLGFLISSSKNLVRPWLKGLKSG
ncbi:glycosyltransferase family 2 protein [Halomonas nitroreducens]|uniref:Glycosyltransferase family 2 protein n=1 Tax=Halomonas nitroreducens TaxID=447425 RepID=A0A3S0JBB3_9GAMM|nr:glycosyltransferase family A protein [Halomonas nitroreducens]RTR05353.1 glycosyltransferase family 2 protein [Halomonas nitroreducens]